VNQGAWRVVPWDGVALGARQREIDNCDVVVNLAGRCVNCRYTAANRQQILQSRVLSTRVVGQAIAGAAHPPRLWLQASTATIYAHRYDRPNDEYTGVLGGGEATTPSSGRFSIDVALAWEQAFDDAVPDGTRKVLLRSAMTLSPDAGGVFDTLLGLVRRGLGGRAGHGRQFMSWIHYQDFIAAIRWLIARDDIAGVVNVASPNPLPNAEFMRILREACSTRFGLPASRWMLENRLVLVGRAGTDVSAASLATLKGRRIAIVEGYAYGPAIEGAGPIFVRTSGEEDSVRQLLATTVDFALIDELVVNYIVEHHPEEAKKRLQLGAIPLVTRQLFFTVNRARADAHAIVKRFNAQLRGMIADRTYHRLLHVEWISADVNGDGTPEYVPQSDKVGTMEPTGAYVVLSTPPPAKPAAPTNPPGFYVGGNLYRDWASVPQSYKDIDPTWRDPRRASGTVFRFTW
jgi:uncharacterized protein (TIGR01777 family)